MVRFRWSSHIEPYQGATDSTISNKVIARRYIGLAVHRGAPKKRKGETSGQQTQGNANYFEGGSSSSPALTLVPPTNFYCQWDGCEQVFDNDETFVEHVKAHANMEKDKKCHWRDCEREEPFQRPAHLKRHIVGHTGEKPYVCEHVNQDGVRRKALCLRGTSFKKHRNANFVSWLKFRLVRQPKECKNILFIQHTNMEENYNYFQQM
uniref:C2H2-type domain-containing protein n=1 Tax=Meloidogyne incognita TaxID=6306 RepID=A0A914NM60_MELIC